TFPDVPTNHWAYGYIEAAAQRGLLKGFPDGRFLPEDPVSKPQIAKIIGQENAWTASPESPTFQDIGKDHWAFPYVEGDFAHGVLQNPDPNLNSTGTTLGDFPATRAQACVMVYRMMEATGAFTPATPTPTSSPSPTSAALRITKASICTQLDADNQPVDPGTTFSASSTTKLYCWLSYTGGTPGKSELMVTWFYEGESITDPTTVQIKQANGTAAFHIEMAEAGSTFPAGSYKAELYADGKLAMTAEFQLN
ncbi:MAG: S-layer homology domain-containing protein, partial [Deltaproteobacteria bacterium]|nr:S-layer homology domain-containing protein [Deltaproteobacteria bacterium]